MNLKQFYRYVFVFVVSLFIITGCGGEREASQGKSQVEDVLLEKVTGKATSEWNSVGEVYANSTYIRTYNGEEYIYAPAKKAGSGAYKIFETEVGESYTVSGELIGADVNGKEIFTARSYITVSDDTPLGDESHVIASSNKVGGSTKTVETFTFVATGTKSYVALRSDAGWKYASARAITVTKVGGGSVPNPPEESSCTELITDNSWLAFGKVWANSSYTRVYDGKEYLYIAAVKANSGLYKSVPTEIGKTYKVSAELLGADVNRNKKFVANSYMTVSSASPTIDKANVIASSNMVTGGAIVTEEFTFVAMGTTSYIAVRSDSNWQYANARMISVKEMGDDCFTPPTPSENVAPVATPTTVTVNEDTTDNVITLAGTDGDNDPLTYALVTQPAHGTVTLNGNVAKYTPTANYAGADSFTFTVNDGTVDSAPVVVVIDVLNVVVPDVTKPIIALIGMGEVHITKGSIYTDAGATATDDRDGNITSDLNITSSINTAIVGTYIVRYNVEDLAGNKADEVIRTITVSEIPDEMKPVITLNGESSVTIEKDEIYIELNATALDDVDGNVTVTISGTVDTFTVGVYTLTYTASDKAGNSATKTRIVNVVGSHEVIIEELNRVLADDSIPYTTDADFNKSEYAKHHLSDKSLNKLNRAHQLVSIAKDPDPTWFKTKSDTPIIIAKSGESYTVNLKKVNKDGIAYAPVDNDKLRLVVRIQRAKNNFEYITNVNINQYAHWDGDGILKINVPQDLDKGRLLIGIRPDFNDVAVSAIAERWSTLISAEVWNLKNNVLIPSNDEVLFPIDNDARNGLSIESLFGLDKISTETKKSLIDDHLLLLPIVIKDIDISKNNLISYEFKGKPYAGKVVKLIKKEKQIFALMSPEYFDIYEIMDLEEGFAEREGLLPEHVIYREGNAFNTDINNSDPVTFNKRMYKKSNKGFFSQNCSVGESEFTYSPKFSLYPLDAGVSVSIHALSKETKCTWKAETKPFNLDNLLAKLGPAGAVLEGIFGAGGELTPFGEVTVSVDQAPGFGVEAGFSLAKGGSFKVDSLAKTLGGIGSRDLTLFSSSAKGEISGNVGMKFTIKAISDDGSIGIIFKWLRLNVATIGLDAEASVKEGLSTNIKNATEVLDSKESSDVAFEIGASAKVSASPDLKNLFNALSIKVTLEAETPTLKILEVKATALHTFSSVDDDGQGKASVNGLILKSRYLRNFLPDAEGVLAPSNNQSSVFNDHSENISYELSECENDPDYKIEVPAIACAGWMCGVVDRKVKLCNDTFNCSKAYENKYKIMATFCSNSSSDKGHFWLRDSGFIHTDASQKWNYASTLANQYRHCPADSKSTINSWGGKSFCYEAHVYWSKAPEKE